MPLTITPELIQKIYANDYTNDELQEIIDDYESRIGECLSSSVGNVQGGRALANFIAYTIYNPTTTIKSEKGSFGDSVTYADNVTGGDSYLMKARTLDTKGCLVNLQNTPLGVITIGQCS